MREAQEISGIRGSFLLDTFLWTSKEKYLVRGYENPHSNNRRVSDTLSCSSFDKLRTNGFYKPSLAVVPAGMTKTHNPTNKIKLKQPRYLPIIININPFRRRLFGQAGHGHHVPGNGDDKPGAIGKPNFVNFNNMP
jgi:hypothetical protein